MRRLLAATFDPFTAVKLLRSHRNLYAMNYTDKPVDFANLYIYELLYIKMIFLLKNIDRRNYNETKKQSKDHAPTLHSPHGQDNDAHHHEHKDDEPIHHHRHQHRRPVRPGIASVGKINKRRARVRRLGREGRKPEKKQEEISILGVIGKELLHMDVKEFHQNKEPKKVERLAVFKRADQKPETNHGWFDRLKKKCYSTTTNSVKSVSYSLFVYCKTEYSSKFIY